MCKRLKQIIHYHPLSTNCFIALPVLVILNMLFCVNELSAMYFQNWGRVKFHVSICKIIQSSYCCKVVIAGFVENYTKVSQTLFTCLWVHVQQAHDLLCDIKGQQNHATANNGASLLSFTEFSSGGLQLGILLISKLFHFREQVLGL